MSNICGRCNQPAEGFATIGGQRFCYSEDAMCYMRESYERSILSSMVRSMGTTVRDHAERPRSTHPDQ